MPCTMSSATSPLRSSCQRKARHVLSMQERRVCDHYDLSTLGLVYCTSAHRGAHFAQADRGDAPFYEAARDVLQGTLTQFLASEDWRQWSMDDAHTAPPDGGVEESKSNQGGSASTLKGSSLAKRGKDTRTDPIEDLLDGAGPGSAASWDGWD